MHARLLIKCVNDVEFDQQWHPDKWSRTPSLLGQAKQKFQQIQEAYSGNICE